MWSFPQGACSFSGHPSLSDVNSRRVLSHEPNGGAGAAGRWSQRLPGGGWEGLRWKDAQPGWRCGWLEPQPYHHLGQCPLTWGSDLGAHSMAWGAAAAPLSSEGEQRGQPQPAKHLPGPAALCHLAGAGAQFDVGIAAWQLRKRRYIPGIGGDWRARQLGLVTLWAPAPRLSPFPPAWT